MNLGRYDEREALHGRIQVEVVRQITEHGYSIQDVLSDWVSVLTAYICGGRNMEMRSILQAQQFFYLTTKTTY